MTSAMILSSAIDLARILPTDVASAMAMVIAIAMTVTMAMNIALPDAIAVVIVYP